MTPRVLHVITRLCVGGAQLTLFESARDLSDAYDLAVAHGPDVGDEGSIEARVAAEFPSYQVPSLRRAILPRDDVRAVRALRAVYVHARPDIIHTHSSKAGIVGRLARSSSPAKLVHSVHGWGHNPLQSAPKRRLLIEAERRLASRADLLIAVSSDVRDEGLSLGIGAAEQYRVVPEYVDYTPAFTDHAEARRTARASLEVPADAEVVGWVGRFMPQKDPVALAGALTRVLDARPETWAVLIGDGPHRQEVETRLRASGAGDRVRFAGFRSDVRSLYAAFDVLLHTSRYEGQPRVVQEAIAERVPVVTARVSGTGDLLASGAVGVEVETGDEAAMAAEVLRRLDDAGLRAPLSEHDIAAVTEHNGRATSERLHRQVYGELLG